MRTRGIDMYIKGVGVDREEREFELRKEINVLMTGRVSQYITLATRI